MSQTKNSARGLGCLFLFALPFAGVGVFMTYLAGVAVLDWFSMRSWVEVPAAIYSVNLWKSRDSDSNSVEVQASYRYEYGGRSFSGSRVAIHKGADSVGSYHRDKHRELVSHRGSTFRCFLNPSDPQQAVLFRDLRFELLAFYGLFIVMFGGAGFGLMGLGFFGVKKAKRVAALEAEHPNEPWKHKEDWASAKIVSTTKPALVTSGIFALVWNLASAPLWFMIPDIVENENKLALLAFAFPLIGLVLVVWAGRNWMRFRKFGESIFEMRAFPGVIGGPFAGTIRTTVNVRPENGFELTLSSVRIVRTRSGKNSHTQRTVLWQRSHRITRELLAHDSRRSAIPVSFAVPFDATPSSETDPDNRVVWKLEVSGELPGVDYHAEFEAPVFTTADSVENFQLEDDTRVTRVVPELGATLRKAGIDVELLPSGKRFVFPRARVLGAAMGLTVFFAVWTAIVVGLHLSDAPRIFPWAFGLFDLLLLLGVADMWLHHGFIEVRSGELSFANGMLFAGSPQKLLRDEAEKLDAKRGMQSGNKLYYQLVVHERGGRKHMLAKRLPDLETTERLIEEIENIVRA